MQVFGWCNTFFFSVLITSCLGFGRKAPRLQITWSGAIQSGPRPRVWAIYYYIKWLDTLFFQVNVLARCLSYFYIHSHYVPLEIKVRSALITICLDCVVLFSELLLYIFWNLSFIFQTTSELFGSLNFQNVCWNEHLKNNTSPLEKAFNWLRMEK